MINQNDDMLKSDIMKKSPVYELIHSIVSDSEMNKYTAVALAKHQIMECEVDIKLNRNSIHHIPSALVAYYNLACIYERKNNQVLESICEDDVAHIIKIISNSIEAVSYVDLNDIESYIGLEKNLIKLNQNDNQNALSCKKIANAYWHMYQKLKQSNTSESYRSDANIIIDGNIVNTVIFSGDEQKIVKKILHECCYFKHPQVLLQTVSQLFTMRKLNLIKQKENYTNECRHLIMQVINSASSGQIKKIDKRINSTEIIQFINALFVSKLCPAEIPHLINIDIEEVHIMQISEVLHYWLETLYESVTFRLYGKERSHDKLLHGKVLFSGVSINVNKKLSEMIKTVIQDAYRLKVVNNIDFEGDDYHYSEIKRSFKFWFNPDRFIDAILALEQRAYKETKDSSLVYQSLEAYWTDVFKNKRTHNLMKLYRCFCGKELNKLISALANITQYAQQDWLSGMDKKHVDTQCRQVFSCIEIPLNLIRKELEARKFKTENYLYFSQHNDEKLNLDLKNTIVRMLNIYEPWLIDASKNSNLDELFSNLS